jgi:outer membrane lipoprotein-sorting protein
MKKSGLLLAGLFIIAVVNSQSLDAIVKSYSTAMKSDKIASVKTIKITGKMSAMGMEMPMTMYMKNPNKIKIVYSFSGQEMVSVFDGEKGYMMNPLMGSSNPVELTGDQLKQVQSNNAFQNELIKYHKNGQVSLEGTEDVNGKPANKLKVNIAGAAPLMMYLDKGTNLLVKTKTSVEQMGTAMDVESYMTDYVDIDGVVMPKKTTAMANGMEAAVITLDKIEVNTPMEESIFKIK